ncbi:tail collar fiber protein [Acinetobacter phage ZZ1]|uniref:Short tail fibers protein n=1 Tax=Acinetobacter phage ZZ1 TaxID=1049283 RepID=G0YKE5_9CAUD|nr:tail collar fiber protein [Acinetobacter phage ZZ1]AEJ90224.1 short tail fibers protein [Acinetobacter phage ZZ1]
MAETPLNNTFKHISDESRYTYFDPTGTLFPATVKTVQEALALTSPTTYATTTQAGTIQLATQAEVTAGVNNTKAVTPATLAERLKYPDATTTVKGIVFLASNAEAQAGTVATNKVVNPAALKYTLDWWWANKRATETANGVLKLSTQAAAQAGVDDTTAMTPLKVKQAINSATSNLPVPVKATESVQGLVTLATVAQVTQGTLREGYAISPYTLMQLKGNLTRYGITRGATLAEANAGTADDLYISAKGFKTYNANDTNFGTVKTTTTVSPTAQAGTVLASNASVLGTNLTTQQTVTGPVNFNGIMKKGNVDVATTKNITDATPIGVIQMWLGDQAPTGGLWALCDGGAESKAARPDLFAVIGYKFGGSGDTFYRPDMRGLYARGAGRGKDIIANTGYDEFNKPLLGNGVDGGVVGQVQKQQIREHKHIVSWGETRQETPNFPFGGTQLSKYWGTAGREDHDNGWMFSNDGTEFEPASVRTEYSTVNSKELIGTETRPWSMSVNYIIKVA